MVELRRKRGGQPGNRNRLRHGAFSAKARERREWVRGLVASTNALIVRIEMVARARKALKAKQHRLTSPNAGRSTQVSASELASGGGLAMNIPPPGTFLTLRDRNVPTSPRWGR